MKTVLFAPYGAYSKESGFLAVISNYLGKVGSEVITFRCNGAFPACGRDEKLSWRRTVSSCLRCMDEQRSATLWAGIKSKDCGTFLTPQDASEVVRWLHGLSGEDLVRAEFRGTNLFSVVQGTFARRFEGMEPNFEKQEEESYLRELLVSAVHALASSERFLSGHRPELCLVANGGDVLSKAFAIQSAAHATTTAVFEYSQESQSIFVRTPGREEIYSTRLIFEGVTSMRNDHRTWAPEIVSVVHEVLSYLGYGPDRAL